MEDFLPRSISVISGTMISLGRIGASSPYLHSYSKKIPKETSKNILRKANPS